ncbi:unnamed protein product [Cladocopium goreaui]|uniref:CCHC-type domain-containing protein n=1 Tax=Cladocopium goreaui TaxID=2562237 RepID=A0A9P1FRP9_9DINO|nr:unnamed protein product [Cladocopium goreaui]
MHAADVACHGSMCEPLWQDQPNSSSASNGPNRTKELTGAQLEVAKEGLLHQLSDQISVALHEHAAKLHEQLKSLLAVQEQRARHAETAIESIFRDAVACPFSALEFGLPGEVEETWAEHTKPEAKVAEPPLALEPPPPCEEFRVLLQGEATVRAEFQEASGSDPVNSDANANLIAILGAIPGLIQSSLAVQEQWHYDCLRKWTSRQESKQQEARARLEDLLRKYRHGDRKPAGRNVRGQGIPHLNTADTISTPPEMMSEVVQFTPNPTPKAAEAAVEDIVTAKETLAISQATTTGNEEERRWIWYPALNPPNWRRSGFLLLEDSNHYILGRIISGFMVAVIMVSTVSFVIETLPNFKDRPQRCQELLAAGAALTVKACEPVPRPIFSTLEAICIAIFSLEYALRLALCHTDARYGSSYISRTFHYAIQPLNVVDVIAVLPFYLKLALEFSEIGVFGMLRLMRVFRLLKLAKHHKGTEGTWHSHFATLAIRVAVWPCLMQSPDSIYRWHQCLWFSCFGSLATFTILAACEKDLERFGGGEGEFLPGTATAASTDGNTASSNHMATLVPTFDPSKDDLEQYTQKVELLSEIWPATKINELITRLILNTSGTAFQKLQLNNPRWMMTNDKKGVQLLVQLLGGQWGKVNLEKKYDIVERALFRCLQKQDESNDSFLARCDVVWSELLAKKVQLEEIQSYILRGSRLSTENKKRVIVESESSSSGVLNMEKVTQSVRMLGTSFFNEMIGQKVSKGKIYESQVMLTEDQDDFQHDESADVADEYTEDEFVGQLLQDDEEDAALIADYESRAADVLQGDSDLAATYNAYADARNERITEQPESRFVASVREQPAVAYFSTYGTCGILDTGLGLKIAIVPGETPLLLSNTLLRTLKASLNSEHHTLSSPLLNQESHGMVPLKNPEDLQGVMLPRSKCMPKSKAMPAHQVPVEVIQEIVDPSDPWDVMDYTALQQDQTNEMIEALQARVLNMEGAISEILGAKRRSVSAGVQSAKRAKLKEGSIKSSLTGDDELPTHAKACEETSEGLRFREMLARRETARRAFHSADNDMSLRRAALRRERPHRGSYEAGEWVMVWKVVSNQGSWYGPAKVIQQDGSNAVFCNNMGSILKAAPEHVRPVSAVEARLIPLDQIAGDNEPRSEHRDIPTMDRNATEPIIPESSNPNNNPITNNNPVPTNPSGIIPNDTNSPPQRTPSQSSADQPDQEPENAETPRETENDTTIPELDP